MLTRDQNSAAVRPSTCEHADSDNRHSSSEYKCMLSEGIYQDLRIKSLLAANLILLLNAILSVTRLPRSIPRSAFFLRSAPLP
jgi:hypothetical protein